MFVENEISFKIEIPVLVYNKIMYLVEKWPHETMTKICYKKPTGFRVLYRDASTTKHVKTVQSSMNGFLFYKKQFIFQTTITKAVEEQITNSDEYEVDNNMESSIQRHYLFLDEKSQLRLAIEKKFHSKYESGNAAEGSSDPMPANPRNFSLDKWSRISSHTYIHVEYEFASGSSAVANTEFEQILNNSDTFNNIMTFVKECCSSISLYTLIESKLDVFSRNFAFVMNKKPTYVAKKLDGVRKTCIIHQNKMIIDNEVTITIPVHICQPIKCHAELVNGVYYIIDILEIWGPMGVYIKPTHIQAIAIMSSEFIKRICIDGKLITNTFFPFGQQLTEGNDTVPNDGLLMFTENAVVKYKEHTVDLILKQEAPLNEKKSKSGKCDQQREDKYSCLEDLLLFADQTPFSAAFPKWSVEMNVLVEDLFYCYSNEFRNFLILEFLIDNNNKKIIFLKKRTDKMQANTKQSMLSMLH